MVREWGMSDRIGPMAWGSQGAVFLGDDLMHSRDYSDETARVIDEEVERILRDEEDRCRKVLTEYRAGLDARRQGARSSARRSSGQEVANIVDTGDGPQGRRPALITHADGTEECRGPAEPIDDGLDDLAD